jgi:hypothetical protein
LTWDYRGGAQRIEVEVSHEWWIALDFVGNIQKDELLRCRAHSVVQDRRNSLTQKLRNFGPHRERQRDTVYLLFGQRASDPCDCRLMLAMLEYPDGRENEGKYHTYNQ